MEQMTSNNAPLPTPIAHEQFMRLFLTSERELLRYVMALVPDVSNARDIVQETAIALWQAIDKYDPSKPFVPWACRFALNEARRFMRAERRQNKRCRVLDDDVAEALIERRIELVPILDARRKYLQDCLRRLPDGQRELVRGYYFDDQSVASLAERLNREVEAVYKSLQRIRQALHHCIDHKFKRSLNDEFFTVRIGITLRCLS